MAPPTPSGLAGLAAQLLRPGEEDWREVFERLCERFPQFSADRIAQVLRDERGHAGQASAVLRDLAGTDMRPVDPDDAEHVRTILSSPAMFKHVCTEQFRRFDVNGDGVLDLSEIVLLVNALYENFGLQPPREAALRSFLKETDTNQDGVLSEREFRKFFEHFLNYAFFDVKAREAQEEPRSSPPRERERESRSRRTTPSEAQDDPRAEQRGGKQERRLSKGALVSRRSPESRESEVSVVAGAYRCIAPNGVTFRKSADFSNRSDLFIQRGEVVQALEHWIRTPHGWLPVAVESGEVMFEAYEAPVKASRAPVNGHAQDAGERRADAGKARGEGCGGPKRSSSRPIISPPGEGEVPARRREKERAALDLHGTAGGGGATTIPEDWRDLFNRLSERFPSASPEEVGQALREHSGHAGQAATRLRELTRAVSS